jgi:hypothetical protein
MRLTASILINAVRYFQRNFEARHPNRRQQFREAQSWIFDGRGNGPFSFPLHCLRLLWLHSFVTRLFHACPVDELERCKAAQGRSMRCGYAN